VTVVGQAPERRVITSTTDLPARITGMPIPAETTVAHLRAIGAEVTVDGDAICVVVPSWRPDMAQPFDLVEEVARIVGYEDVPSVLPTAPAGRGLTEVQRLRRRVGRVIAGAGFSEVISYPFTSDADHDALGLPSDDERRRALRMENPLNAEQPLLATTLLPGVLHTLARNVGRANADAAVFETALVFLPTGDEKAPILGTDRRPTDEEWAAIEKAVPAQPQHLALALTGARELDGWWGPGRAAGWSDAIGAVRDLAGALGVTLDVEAAAIAPWHPGRCAALSVDGVLLGHAGELHPKVCKAFGLPARSAAAEIDLDALLEHATSPQAPRFSAYPVAKEDVALVVDASVPSAAVEAALREGAGELLESIRLFDVFTGAQVGDGKKSLAFALRFRASDRTLKEGESAAARDAAVARAAEVTGAVQR
jgi:phenylalanyl-tRNA synthetase beta chain